MSVTTSAHPVYGLDVSTIFHGGNGRWEQTPGTIVLNVSQGQVMKAGRVYEFSFKLHNPTQADIDPDGRTWSAGNTNYASGLTVVANPIMIADTSWWTGSGKGNGPIQTFDNWYTAGVVYNTLTLSSFQAYNIKEYELRPSYVRQIDIELAMVNQSKPFPCAINQINVALRLNVPLLSTCKNPNTIANVYNYTPGVSITGLTGTTSDDNTVFAIGDAPFLDHSVLKNCCWSAV
jgi:hypothetical protein